MATEFNTGNDASLDEAVKSRYEANADTNPFTDNEKSKLAGIGAGAEANTVDSVNGATGAVSLNADDIDDSATAHKFATAAQLSKLDGIDAGAEANTVDSVNGATGAVSLNADDIDDSATAHKFATAAQLSKVDGIEAGATADQTGAEMVTAIDNELGGPAWQSGGGGTALVNNYNATAAPTADDDASDTSGNGAFSVGSLWIDVTNDFVYRCVDATATAAVWLRMVDGVSGADDDAVVWSAGRLSFEPAIVLGFSGTELSVVTHKGPINVNEFTIGDADGNVESKTVAEARTLLNVEDGADVTDTANVTAAGALMDSEVANLAAVKAFDPADYATASQGAVADNALQEVVDDTAPRLGGDLDGQGNEIANYINSVVTSASGALSVGVHSGNIVVTNGNVTVPATAGFTCTLIAGGAHTVTFNGNTSAAMAAGDVMTLFVESGTAIHAVLTAASGKVGFS